MLKNNKILSVVCCLSVSLGATAANWTITDGVAAVSASCELSASDQETLNGLTSIVIGSNIQLYVKTGDTVTIPCAITGPAAYKLGKTGTGVLVIAGQISSTHSTKDQEISLYGTVIFASGSSIGNRIGSLSTGDNSESTVMRFSTVFESGYGPSKIWTRGMTAVAFDQDNVFDDSESGNPLVVLGRNSNPAGILNLNGHDQRIGRLAFFCGNSMEYIAAYNPYHYITSDTAATLTISSGFATTSDSGSSAIFNGTLQGGVSFKLDSVTGGVASFSNTFENVSSTTGSLVCASGTIRLLEGARFSALASICKEGNGNFEISTPVINSTADLYLDGTGKITLNSNINVAHAYTNDTNGAWVMLKAGDYDAMALGDHLAGAGILTVLHDGSGEGETVTYTWTGALGNGTLAAGGNWEGGEAPTLSSANEFLVFPATGTSSFRVDGEITVGSISIAYPGSFTVAAGGGAKINLGDGGLSVADTTMQTNTITLAAPIALKNGIADVMFSVGDGTALNIAGGISASSSYGRHLVIDGGALTFGGDSSGMFVEMVVTNAVSISVVSPSGLGAAGARLYNIPYFATRTCTSPWTLVASFPTIETPCALYQEIAGSPVVFSGAVRIEGSPEISAPTDKGIRYLGLAVFSIANDTTFCGGLSCAILTRLQFNIANGASLNILDNPIVRGEASDYGLRADLRFYGESATNSFVVTDQQLDSIDSAGVYVARCSLVCAADECIGGQFTPYVNSLGPDADNSIWSRFDLAGHSQTIARLLGNPTVAANFPNYPDSFVEVTSADSATLLFGSKTTYVDIHQLKFSGASSLRTASPWVGTLAITNTVSTTTGDMEIMSGTVEFQKDAGWGVGTNVTVAGTGVLRMGDGAKGFSGMNGRASRVALKLAGEGKIDIPAAGTIVSVGTCDTNGVRLARGYYTAASLPEFVTGAGTLHVRKDYPQGFVVSFR